MNYSKPTILATQNSSVAIQNGSGATSHGQAKNGVQQDFDGSPQMRSTTAAYEADE